VFISSILSFSLLCNNGLSKYSGGSGEPNNPYKIATAEDLDNIGNHTEDYNKCFILTADINLAGYTGTQFHIIGTGHFEGFEPVFISIPFTGKFDGNNLKVSNFNYICKGPGPDFFECRGLFGVVNGTNAEIKNLRLVNANISVEPGDRVASLVGFFLNGTITDCYIEGGSVSGDYRVGGLVGQSLQDTLISDCCATSSISGHSAIGGLIGSTYYGIISNCCSNGSITATSSTSSGYFVGGLIGANYYGTISNCYATGDVSVVGSGYHVGGLVGENRGSISNSYATGNVTSEDGSKIGGLVGINSGPISNSYSTGNVTLEVGSYIGGLVGCNSNNGSILNCYAAGNVSAGGSDIGGLVGLNYGTGTVTTSFWDIEASSQVSSDGGIGKTTSEMQTESTFTDVGWDFVEVWNIGGNQTYPFLRIYSAGDLNHDHRVNFFDFAILASHWLEGTSP
jgi:hypothetical protein